MWTSKLASEEDFLHYSKEASGERFTKFVVDLKTSAIYYADADLYPMHKDFVFAELLKVPRTKEAEQRFNRNYGKDKPDFLMCYLVHHLGPDVWTLAFWDGDKATAAHVRLAFARMRETFYLASKVKFRPNSNDQEAVAAELDEIPFVTNDVLYKAVGYQPFHKGTAVGKLRIVRAAPGDDPTSLTFAPDEIVILPEPLTDITPVAGIVSESFSTPLSHVNLRAATWDIPNAGLRNAAKTYAALDGKVVRFEAGATNASLRLATPEEIAASQKERRERTAVKLRKANLEPTKLAPLDTLRAADASAYGSKTANLGEIVSAKLPGVAVPPGFGVPISFYAAHLHAAGIDARIEAMLSDPTFLASLDVRKKELAKLRQEIQDAPLAPAFVSSLGEALQKLALVGRSRGRRRRGRLQRVRPELHHRRGPSRVLRSGPLRHRPERARRRRRRERGEEGLGERLEPRCLRGARALPHRPSAASTAGCSCRPASTQPRPGCSSRHTPRIRRTRAPSPSTRRTASACASSTARRCPRSSSYNTFNKGLRIVSRSDEDTMLVFQQDGGVQEVPNPRKGAPILSNSRVARLADAAQKIRGVFPKDRPLDIEWVLRGEEVFIVQARPFQSGPATFGTSPRPTR